MVRLEAARDPLRVEFRPARAAGEAEPGEPLLRVAHRLGVDVMATCGARGRCTSCRVKLLEGRLSPPMPAEIVQLGAEQVAEGFRLACQAEPRDHSVVLVSPPLVETAFQILADGTAEWTEPLDPGVSRVDCRIELSTDEGDQVSDVERLLGALGGKLTLSPRLLRVLPRVVRASEGAVRVTRYRNRVIAVEPAAGASSDLYGLAADVGTTTVVTHLVDLGTGRTVRTLSSLNPQATFGGDLMSRIAYAQTEPGGTRQLQIKVLGLLNQHARQLATAAMIGSADIHRAVIVGNSCMHHLLLGIDPESLGLAPYAPILRDEYECTAAEFGLRINPEAPVIFAPLVAGFVGADTVAAILSARLAESEAIHCLVDIGTNGEVVLGSRRGLWACSAPAGPAFEGGQVSCGMRGAHGAIHKVSVRGADLVIETIGGAAPLGICGSGLLDLVATLLDHGIIHPSGRLQLDPPGLSPGLRARLRVVGEERQFVVATADETATGREIWLSQRDIRQVQLAKGAIASGIAALEEVTGIGDEEIVHFSLAGGFGNYLDIDSAQRIGLIPPLPRDRVQYVGNAAADGARRMLLSEAARERATSVARAVRHVPLATFPGFQEIFAEAVTFPAARHPMAHA